MIDPNFLVEGQTIYKKETYGDFIRESLKNSNNMLEMKTEPYLGKLDKTLIVL